MATDFGLNCMPAQTSTHVFAPAGTKNVKPGTQAISMIGNRSHNLLWWSRSLNFGFRFHSHSLCGKRVVQIIIRFWVFNAANYFRPRAKNFRCVELEPEMEPDIQVFGSTALDKTTLYFKRIFLVSSFREDRDLLTCWFVHLPLMRHFISNLQMILCCAFMHLKALCCPRALHWNK